MLPYVVSDRLDILLDGTLYYARSRNMFAKTASEGCGLAFSPANKVESTLRCGLFVSSNNQSPAGQSRVELYRDYTSQRCGLTIVLIVRLYSPFAFGASVYYYTHSHGYIEYYEP